MHVLQSQFLESGFPRRALPFHKTEDTRTSKENEALDDDTKQSGEDEVCSHSNIAKF